MPDAWEALMAWRDAEARAAIARAEYETLAARQNAPKSNTLPPHQRACLCVLARYASDDAGYLAFRQLASEAELPLPAVKRAVRRLARMGLAGYGRGLWSDDGPAGAGYTITRAGARFYEALPLDREKRDG